MKINPKLKQIICIWLGLFPTSLTVNFLLADWLQSLDPIIKIIVTTIIIVPIMVLVMIPFTFRIISKFLK